MHTKAQQGSEPRQSAKEYFVDCCGIEPCSVFVKVCVAADAAFSCPGDRRDSKSKDATAFLANIPRRRRREAVGYKGCEAFKRRSGGADLVAERDSAINGLSCIGPKGQKLPRVTHLGEKN